MNQHGHLIKPELNTILKVILNQPLEAELGEGVQFVWGVRRGKSKQTASLMQVREARLRE